ncbi:MAG: acetylornithine/succinylornithine family transaminase [Chloroflexi bacterium]|nr:acetylornithine/succinylornithine family transaminase [Chloroflexota bacterium]
MTGKENVIAAESQYVLQTYKRPPFVLERGEGMTLFDSEGKAYLDWVSGIAVNALGYRDAEITRAAQSALDAGIIHLSNLYHSEAHTTVARLLCEHSFADKVFFCNSGAEANEGAIKFARRVSHNNDQPEKHEILCFSGAFHGRTTGALALTPREAYQAPFRPLLPGVATAQFNDIESAHAAIGPQTAAVIVEPLQGEGGIHPADPAFLKALRTFCDEQDAILIFDEIQCGLGRTGTLWAYESFGVEPDIMTLAKPLAGGLPMGAILLRDHVARHIQAGDHGSTFAGGLLVARVAEAVLERIRQPAFLNHVREVGTYLGDRLAEINLPCVVAQRGSGFLQGLELDSAAAPIVDACYEQGHIITTAGANILRFVPPLIAERSQVDSLIEALTGVLQGATQND